jgi:hypothetical protein
MSSGRFRLAFVLASAMSLVTFTSAARADETFQPLQPQSRGWVVVALSLAAGMVLSGVSATIKCPSDDLNCQRWASLGIWGGIGVASAGSTAGLLIVDADARFNRARLSVSVQPGTAGPRANLIYRF